MKAAVIVLLSLSLAANVFFARRELGEAGKRQDSGVQADSTIDRVETFRRSLEAARRASARPTRDSSYFDDLRSFASELINDGVEPDLVRAILQARLNEALELRRNTFLPAASSSPYWKFQVVKSSLTLAQSFELRQMDRENFRFLDEVFGTEPSRPSLQTIRDDARFGLIKSESVRQLKMIEEDYSDVNTALIGEMRLATLPEDRRLLGYVGQEKDRDLRSVLPENEYFEYQLRNSQPANRLRTQLEVFDPTEEEYRKLYALQQAFEEEFPTENANIDEIQANYEKRMAAQVKLNRDIRATLGADRAEAYARFFTFCCG